MTLSKPDLISSQETRYGASPTVQYCKRCVMPNQRPSSSNEWAHHAGTKHKFLQFDEEGVCYACRFNEAKKNGVIDWKKRDEELRALLDQHRSKDGSYDCLVPGSGGKDSGYASHILKAKYGMHPLTVTWAPHLYTDIGWKNFTNWIHMGGFDNYLFTPNGKIHRLITRNATLNLMHPFQPFILGQKTFAVKMAARFNIPLIFYGEAPGEYGARVSIDQNRFVMGDEKKGDSQSDGFRLDFVSDQNDYDSIYLGGKKVSDYLKEGVELGDLQAYLPLATDQIRNKGIEFHYLGYYLKWVPQESYYYCVENLGFEANPVRTEGTYSKYNSIDDKTDGFFYYTTSLKFGYGRATQDAAQEIRNDHLTREEGVALVRKYDGEFPVRYSEEFFKYIGMDKKEFVELSDRFRSEHLSSKLAYFE